MGIFFLLYIKEFLVDVQPGKTSTFLKYLKFEKRYSAHTVRSYQTDLGQFEEFLKSNYPNSTSTQADHPIIRSWIIELSESHLDQSTINRKIACLRSYYKFLVREDLISDSPMQKIRVLKTKKKLPHFVKEADMASLLDRGVFEDNLAGWRQRLILELFYGTGMRLSELISLKENQINLRDRTLKVLGKRNKERVIPFGASLVPIIESYKRARNWEVGDKGNGLLLITNTGKPLYPMMVNRIAKKYLSLFSSVEKKSPHVLRHTYATHLLNKGAEINAVKDLLGHSSLAATQVYTHNTFERLKKAFDQAHPKA
jgi:integrase/recombinase XerC